MAGTADRLPSCPRNVAGATCLPPLPQRPGGVDGATPCLSLPPYILPYTGATPAGARARREERRPAVGAGRSAGDGGWRSTAGWRGAVRSGQRRDGTAGRAARRGGPDSKGWRRRRVRERQHRMRLTAELWSYGDMSGPVGRCPFEFIGSYPPDRSAIPHPSQLLPHPHNCSPYALCSCCTVCLGR